MKQKLMNGCLSMLLALGCSGKLTVDRNEPRNAGGQGGEGETAEPGMLGGPCVPGELRTEAKGSVAEAEMRLPDRCNDALLCGPDQVCVTAPTCADSTDRNCVVYEARESGAIMALAGDDSHLYFLTYGTADKLGNYLSDGALLVSSIAEGTTTTIASGLKGPKDLGITSSHAYFWVDGGVKLGAPGLAQLFRVPLDGGPPELVDGTAPSQSTGTAFFASFASVGDQAIWSGEAATYAMAASADAAPTVLLESRGGSLVTEGGNLFYAECVCPQGSSGIWRVPAAGGTPEPLVSPYLPFGVRGDNLYGLESLTGIGPRLLDGVLGTVWTGTLLTRAPKSGGQWERVRALGGGGPVTQFRLVGERYFYEQESPQGDLPYTDGYSTTAAVVTGSLTSNEPPVRLLELPPPVDWFHQVWFATSEALFWTDGTKVYSRTLEP